MPLIIFDCDGVLVDSERLAIEIDRRKLAELGWQLTFEETIERFMGRSYEAAIATITGYLEGPPSDEWIASWKAEFARAFAEDLTPVPGIEGAITAVGDLGYATAVGTSGARDATALKLHKTGLANHFDADAVIVTADDVENAKPAPDIFLAAAEQAGFAPADCVVIEDSPPGVAAARAAKMLTIGYIGGVSTAAMLTDADRLIEDMAQLAPTLKALEPRPRS